MDIRTLALILSAAAIGAGCASKETKPEPAPPPVAAEAPPAKPTCPPETSAKIKSTKKKGKKEEVAPVDCEPAKPKATNTSSKAAPVAAPVAASPATTPPPRPGQRNRKAGGTGQATDDEINRWHF